jgi:hypothetical protein
MVGTDIPSMRDMSTEAQALATILAVEDATKVQARRDYDLAGAAAWLMFLGALVAVLALTML